MAENQINKRSRAFIDEANLRDQIFFASDRESELIARFGIKNDEAEPMERGVPYPTTIIADRKGVIRFIDIRKDFHIWLAPETIIAELAKVD